MICNLSPPIPLMNWDNDAAASGCYRRDKRSMVYLYTRSSIKLAMKMHNDKTVTHHVRCPGLNTISFPSDVRLYACLYVCATERWFSHSLFCGLHAPTLTLFLFHTLHTTPHIPTWKALPPVVSILSLQHSARETPLLNRLAFLLLIHLPLKRNYPLMKSVSPR